MSQVDSKKYSLKEIFSSPRFYLALIPHVITLWLVLINDLSYYYVFLIFLAELIIDAILLGGALLFMENERVQALYQSLYHKSILAFRTIVLGILFCLFFGFFATIFVFNPGPSNFLTNVLSNNTIWLAVGIYLISKLVSFGINVYRYKTGQQLYIEKGLSFVINLGALIVFVMPGTFLFLLLKPFIASIQLIAIVLLFALRAYIDSVFAAKKEEIDTSINKYYG